MWLFFSLHLCLRRRKKYMKYSSQGGVNNVGADLTWSGCSRKRQHRQYHRTQKQHIICESDKVVWLTNLWAALEQCKNVLVLRNCSLMQPSQHVSEVSQWIMWVQLNGTWSTSWATASQRVNETPNHRSTTRCCKLVKGISTRTRKKPTGHQPHTGRNRLRV